jgi:hypothetical protein
MHGFWKGSPRRKPVHPDAAPAPGSGVGVNYANVPAARARLAVRAAILRLLTLPGGSTLLRRFLSLPL